MAVLNQRWQGTLTITDNTGTPVVFTVTYYSEVKIEPGRFNVFFHRNEKGDFGTNSPTRGDAQTSKISFKAKQIGLSGQSGTGNLTIGDYILHSGGYSSLTSMLTEVGTNTEKVFDIAITFTDGTNTTTHTLENAIIYGSYSVGEEANMYDLTCEGMQAYPTSAYA